MKLLIFTDGASRGNPGKSASGYAIYDSQYNLIEERAFYNGIATNNEAEYLAIIKALEAAGRAFDYAVEIELYSDSRLAINQLAGNFRIKSPKLKELNKRAKELLSKFKGYRLVNPRRNEEHISKVDKSLNVLLDKIEKKGEDRQRKL